jgi:AcrR family transcriptional regulator
MREAGERIRRVRPPEERRRELLDSAVRLFADRGPGGVSVADITDRARVATGTFYRSFPTKDDLVIELRRDALAQLRDRAVGVATEAAGQDWWAGVDAMVGALIDFWWEDIDRARVVLSGTADDAGEVEGELLTLLAGGLRLGQQLGLVGDVDPDVAASLVLHGVLGLVYHAIIDGEGQGPAPLADEIRRQLRRLLRP